MKLNPRGSEDSLKVFVKTREGNEVTLNAYLSPEFDEEGFLRVMGQHKCLCIHKSNVSHFTWEFLDDDGSNSLRNAQAVSIKHFDEPI